MLRDFKNSYDPDYYPHLVNKLKIRFLQWQSEKKINLANCPRKLKQVFSEINEALEGNKA
jgi:hypothetical protein